MYWWVYNRRSSETTGKRVAEEDRKITVDLTKHARKQVLPYQAYMSLHNETIVATAREAYKEHVASVPQEERMKWLAFMTKTARELYDKESEEVKAEVEKYRTKLSQNGSALVRFASIPAGTADPSLSVDAHEIQKYVTHPSCHTL